VKKQLIQYFEKSFITRTSIWYLAYYKNIAVGIGGVMIREQPANFINPGGLFGYIINMFTSADFRRRKISSSILDLLISAAQREGVTAFELHATKEGEYVYKQKGFKIHHEPTYRRILKAG
jgi:GNAT superfamily N-acetyltransferase